MGATRKEDNNIEASDLIVVILNKTPRQVYSRETEIMTVNKDEN
jgi:hypothetical protein